MVTIDKNPLTLSTICQQKENIFEQNRTLDKSSLAIYIITFSSLREKLHLLCIMLAKLASFEQNYLSDSRTTGELKQCNPSTTHQFKRFSLTHYLFKLSMVSCFRPLLDDQIIQKKNVSEFNT